MLDELDADEFEKEDADDSDIRFDVLLKELFVLEVIPKDESDVCDEKDSDVGVDSEL